MRFFLSKDCSKPGSALVAKSPLIATSESILYKNYVRPLLVVSILLKILMQATKPPFARSPFDSFDKVDLYKHSSYQDI